MNNHLKHHADENDLWRAVLYVLGEGTADDRARFEDQLCFDEALCETLVEATRLVELTTTGLRTSALSGQPVRSAQDQQATHRRQLRPVAAIAGTAAAVLFAMGLAGNSSSDSISDAELVTQMLHNTATEEDTDVDSALNDWSSDIDTPQWLLTALELEESDAPADKTLPDADDSSI